MEEEICQPAPHPTPHFIIKNVCYTVSHSEIGEMALSGAEDQN